MRSYCEEGGETASRCSEAPVSRARGNVGPGVDSQAEDSGGGLEAMNCPGTAHANSCQPGSVAFGGICIMAGKAPRLQFVESDDRR